MGKVPDALFPTNNQYGIPLLRLDRQADFVDAPVEGWGSLSRRDRMRGTWHFFVDDIKFSNLWSRPDMVINTKAVSAVEVNYTTNNQMPKAVGLYRIYQKRWLARYWQEEGLRIFVDLNVADEFDEMNLLGVPEGWSSFATSASDSKLDLLGRQLRVAKGIAGANYLNFMVYGGGQKTIDFCAENDLVFIADARNAARS